MPPPAWRPTRRTDAFRLLLAVTNTGSRSRRTKSLPRSNSCSAQTTRLAAAERRSSLTRPAISRANRVQVASGATAWQARTPARQSLMLTGTGHTIAATTPRRSCGARERVTQSAPRALERFVPEHAGHAGRQRELRQQPVGAQPLRDGEPELHRLAL